VVLPDLVPVALVLVVLRRNHNLWYLLSPARVSNVLLDYTTPGDIKQYYKLVAGLKPKFDLSSSGMLGFVCAFQDRARIANWQMTLSFEVQGVLSMVL
jgi:hypothetical protein